MGKLINITGQKFERLTVLYLDKEKTEKTKSAHWVCQCECGKTVVVNGRNLRKGTTKSCGCLRKEKASLNTKKDLVGQKFGKLTVLKDSGKRKNNRVIWFCQCDYGNFYEVDTNSLTSNNTQSCGCLHNEIISNLNKKDLANQKFGKLTALFPTNKRIDNKVVWQCRCDCGQLYEVASSHLISGHTSSCGCIKHSIGEENIANILKQNNIKFQKEVTFSDLISDKNHKLRYDFYLPIFNRLIEFDGQQHYEDTGWHTLEDCQKNDKIKNNYAIMNNIDLVRIPYWERDNITLEMLLGDQYLIKGE